MSRNHRKLRAFQIADSLVMDIYRETKDFPQDEWYGKRRGSRTKIGTLKPEARSLKPGA
jgi:hypothetical protein